MKWSSVKSYLRPDCCRFLWVCGAHRWVEPGVSPTETPGSTPDWRWPPPEPAGIKTEVYTTSGYSAGGFDGQISVVSPTWNFTRLLSASGNRSMVFFFTCILSSSSEFPSSLCFNSFNTYTKHITGRISIHLCSFGSFWKFWLLLWNNLLHITPNT